MTSSKYVDVQVGVNVLTGRREEKKRKLSILTYNVCYDIPCMFYHLLNINLLILERVGDLQMGYIFRSLDSKREGISPVNSSLLFQ